MNMSKCKLIKGGGSSFCEAVKNIENTKLVVMPSKDRCMFVISNAPHMAGGSDSALDEADAYEKWMFHGKKGGTVVFFTDVNSKALVEGPMKNWLLQKFATVKNRVMSGSILDRIRRRNSVYAWTIGKYLRGVYTGEDQKTFDENSISVDIIGVDRKTLFAVAEEIKDAFKQESVLVEDHSNGEIYFVS